MVLSIIFLEDKHKIVLHLSIFYEYQQFFQHRICFSIQPQLQLVNLHRNRRYFRHKTSHMVLSIIFLEDKHKILLHLSIFYEYQQFFQHRICFSIQLQLLLVNLHRNRRYFVIKLHTGFCLSYFLKTNIRFYCIYKFFMSINSLFNTVSVSRYSHPDYSDP